VRADGVVLLRHRRYKREVCLARGGIREHDAFLGHEMRGPAGTGCGGVSMAGGGQGQVARKGNGVRGHRLPSPPCLFRICLFILAFCLDEKGCWQTSVLILILVAFITGNSSLEPLIEGLYAQIHVNLR